MLRSKLKLLRELIVVDHDAFFFLWLDKIFSVINRKRAQIHPGMVERRTDLINISQVNLGYTIFNVSNSVIRHIEYYFCMIAIWEHISVHWQQGKLLGNCFIYWIPVISSGIQESSRLLHSPLLFERATLRWRHNGRDSVSNHQPHHCLLNRLFRRRSKKASKLRATDPCVGNSPGTGEFPAQMASNAANVSIWWRHHESLGHDP